MHRKLTQKCELSGVRGVITFPVKLSSPTLSLILVHFINVTQICALQSEQLCINSIY